jgi:hypothetical protein
MMSKQALAKIDIEALMAGLRKEAGLEEEPCPYCSNENWKVYHKSNEECPKNGMEM